MNGSAVAALIRRSPRPALARTTGASPAQILDNYAEAPFETAESLAALAGVSKAAVVRFATRVGFSGFTELHAALRHEAVERLERRDGGEHDPDGGGVLGRFVGRARADLASRPRRAWTRRSSRRRCGF